MAQKWVKVTYEVIEKKSKKIPLNSKSYNTMENFMSFGVGDEEYSRISEIIQENIKIKEKTVVDDSFEYFLIEDGSD